VYTIPNPDDYYKIPNTFSKEAVESFSGVPIIYTLTSNAASLFKELHNVNKRVIVITHSSDIPADQTLYDMMPSTVVKWFSQNVTYYGETLHGIPIGLENAQRKEFHHQDKPAKILAKAKTEKTYKNLCYLNCSIWTHHEERSKCYRHIVNRPWATTVTNPNIMDFDGFIDNIYRHKFVACPRGNGIDTHRTWETLYLDSIPIEIQNGNNIFWRDLPICLVQNWNDVTEEFLNKEYDRIMHRGWNLDKLDFSYWANLINNYAV
jgi:hypothetical protein